MGHIICQPLPGLLSWYPVMHCQTSNIGRTLVGNKIVDHSDVVGASPVGAAPTTSSFSTWHGLGKDKCKTRQEAFKFWDLVWFDSNQVCAGHLRIWRPWWKSMGAWSPNELQRLDLKIGQWDDSPSIGCQGVVPYWQDHHNSDPAPDISQRMG